MDSDTLLQEVQQLHKIIGIQATMLKAFAEHYQVMSQNLHVVQMSAVDIANTLRHTQEQLQAEIATLPDRRPTAGGSG